METQQPPRRYGVPPAEQTTAVVVGVTVMSTVVVIGAIVLAGISEEDVTPLVTILLGFLGTATMSLVSMLKTSEVAHDTKASGQKLDAIAHSLNGGFEERIAGVVERVLATHGVVTPPAATEVAAGAGQRVEEHTPPAQS